MGQQRGSTLAAASQPPAPRRSTCHHLPRQTGTQGTETPALQRAAFREHTQSGDVDHFCRAELHTCAGAQVMALSMLYQDCSLVVTYIKSQKLWLQQTE